MMKIRDTERRGRQCFIQGFLTGILPAALLMPGPIVPLFSGIWAEAARIAFALSLVCGAAVLLRRPALGKTLLSAGIAFGLFLLYPRYRADALNALFTGVAFIALAYYLFSSRITAFKAACTALRLERFRGSSLALIVVTMFSPLFSDGGTRFGLVCMAGVFVMLGTFAGVLGAGCDSPGRRMLYRSAIAAGCAAAALLAYGGCIVLPAFFLAVAGLVYAMAKKHSGAGNFDFFLAHPGRCVFLTFALLCAAGALLLRTPAAMVHEVSVIDAAFTAVSGVCVTGLSVFDISKELTFTGRLFLLALIQAGGLGIMTLTALVFHALGRRISLNQEQMLAELTASDEPDVFESLKTIVKVTFFCEAAGAAVLVPCFLHAHGDWLHACELGVFTSVSAFCNAGFFPGSANLVPYSGDYLLLAVTAVLIVVGGIAPAVTVSFLRGGFGRARLPLVSRLVLGCTAALLAGSAFLLLLFEWDGIFAGLTPAGKAVNAFFLSASLRTAGFNTVAMEASGIPAVLIMLLCMFIGGAPGGTAGGIKGTTAAILALSLRAAARGEGEVVLDGHRVPAKSVVQAVAVVFSAALVLFFAVIMTVTTQSPGAREMIFECFSALGTVGLSLGATAELDVLGKAVIMATMFLGRIGPLTLFLMFADRRGGGKSGYPPARIPLG